MAEESAQLAEKAAEPETQGRVPNCMQRCVMPECGATYGLRERVYVCPACGGPLEIDCNTADLNGAALRKQWEARAASRRASRPQRSLALSRIASLR